VLKLSNFAEFLEENCFKPGGSRKSNLSGAAYSNDDIIMTSLILNRPKFEWGSCPTSPLSTTPLILK